MFNLSAVTSAVSVDDAGRPLQIRVGRERLRINALEAMRDETAAHPVETGPRTVFVVRAHGRRYRLVHLLRQRRWTVEELGDPAMSLSQAA